MEWEALILPTLVVIVFIVVPGVYMYFTARDNKPKGK